MDILNVKSGNEWVSIPAIQGPQGAKGDKGDPGVKGEDGQDGFSPTVSVTPISGGQRITITDATGPHTADILNGDPSSLIAVQNTEPQGSDVQLWIDDTNAPEGIQVPTYEEHLEGLAQKAPIIINSKSGNPIVINDGVPGLKLYDMKVSFSPKQAGSGDPSPSNIRPITGWDGVNIHRSGKNLLDVNDEKKLAFNSSYSNWSSENGIVTITGNATGGYIMLCTPNTQYAYSFDTTYRGGDLAIRVYEFAEYPTLLTNGSLIYNENTTTSRPPVTFTTSATGKWLVVGFYGHHGSGNEITISNMQVELGSTATAYEPYSGTIIPISWQTEAGTVYCGTLDAMTGVLTVTHKRVKVSDFTWTYNTNGVMRMASNTPSDMLRDGLVISDNYKTVPKVGNWSSFQTVDDYSITQYAPSDNLCIVIKDSRYTVPATFVSEQGNVEIVYELAEPYVVQLDPVQIALLAGTNIVWTDADTAEIAYPVDTKKYVDAVANIPYATQDVYGLVKVCTDATVARSYGVVMEQGLLRTSPAGYANLQAGTASRMPITPARQHESVFFALSKLAGVDLASQTVTLGQYPDAAKIAIQKMLGVYQAPWELIRSDSFTNAESAEYEVTVDQDGNPFELTDVVVQVSIPANSETVITSYGAIKFHYGTGSNAYRSALLNNFTGPKTTNWYGAAYRLTNGNMVSYVVTPFSESGNNRWCGIRNQDDFVLADSESKIIKISFRSVLGTMNYKIYGRRKWT